MAFGGRRWRNHHSQSTTTQNDIIRTVKQKYERGRRGFQSPLIYKKHRCHCLSLICGIEQQTASRCCGVVVRINETMTATQQDISNRCFSRQDIELFGILKHPVHVFDVQNQQMWWANHAALRDIWQAKTLEDLLTRDFTDTTAATTIRMQGILSRIEAGDICREQWTLYPNGKAQTVEIIISLIKIDDGRSAFLCEASDLDNKDFDESRTRGIEMFRHVSIALCEFSATGNPIYRNAEDLKMLGTCFEDRFVDKNLGKKLLQMIQIGKEIDTEAEQKRADGATRWYSVALRNGKDPVSGDRVIIYSGRDITDIVQARRDVSQAKMKSEFLNVIAHELRTVGVNAALPLDIEREPRQ